MDDYLIMAELRGLSSWLGEVYSGEMKFVGARVSVTARRTREGEEIGRWWRIPRVSGGGGRRFIGLGGRRRGSWRGQASQARQRAASQIGG
jgi:hypothetical protein